MNRDNIKDDVRRLIDAYNLLVDGIDHKADESDRAPMKKRKLRLIVWL